MIIKVGPKVISTEIQSGYSVAKARFESILSEKLGVTSKRPAMPTRANQSTADNLRQISDITPAQIDRAFANTELSGLGQAFVDAGQKYNIDARFLAALAAHESAFGSSTIAKQKNNLFGFTAYDSSPFQSATTFTSKEQSIDRVANYISKNYLTEGGIYFNGLSVEAIGKKYASDPLWAEKVIKHMENIK